MTKYNVEHKKIYRRELLGNTTLKVMTRVFLGMGLTYAFVGYYKIHDANDNKLIIIYNSEPVLARLKWAMDNKLSQLFSAYDEVSQQRYHYRLDNTPDDVTIAIRTEAKEFSSDFHDAERLTNDVNIGRRQIEVVVFNSFIQRHSDETLADEFIQQLKLQLMQAIIPEPIQRNRNFYDMPVIHIY